MFVKSAVVYIEKSTRLLAWPFIQGTICLDRKLNIDKEREIACCKETIFHGNYYVNEQFLHWKIYQKKVLVVYKKKFHAS